MKNLILLHGFPFDSSMWDNVKSYFPSSLNVITPDLRGVSRTLSIGAPPSIEIMSDDVANMMEEKNIKEAYVAGMSMGGYVALQFAEKYKAKLSGFALINSHATCDTPEAKAARYALINKIQKNGISAVTEAMLSKVFSDERADWKTFFLSGCDKAGAEGLCWMLEAMALRQDKNKLLGSISVPSLVIHSELDPLIPEQRARDIVKCLTYGQLVVIPKCGHSSPIESPHQVAKALLKWCERE